MRAMDEGPLEREAQWDADRVAGLRYRLGLSQEEFARRLGVRQQTVSEWETGLHTPRGASKRVLALAEEQAPYGTAARPAPRPRRRKP